MKIDNSFTVSVPVDRAWEVLTDLEGVSLCLPGARVTGVEAEVYSGEVRIKVGPVVSQYAGTAQFVEKDDTLHRAVIDAKGRDSRGAGNASALITVQLRADGDHTAATVDTDMKISGKIAQLGGGMIKEVSEKLLGQFVECLEAKFATSQPPGTTAIPVPSEPAAGGGPTETPATAASCESPTFPASPAERPVTGPAAASTTSAVPTPSAQPTPSVQSPPSAQPLDLMALAGGTLARRLLPVVVAALVVAVIVVYLVERGARGAGR